MHLNVFLLGFLIGKAYQLDNFTVTVWTSRHYIQVKNNEIVDSGSLKGDHYIQVNFTVNIWHDFQEVVR